MSKRSYDDHNARRGPPPKRHQFIRPDHQQAYTSLPPPTFPALIPPTPHATFTSAGLPTLPALSPALSNAPFRHKSTLACYNRTLSGADDLSYERLEFLGDAYIELFASRLIFSRYAHLPAGRMSQLRELLVKNETLAEYAGAYGLEARIEIGDFAGVGIWDSSEGGGVGGGGGKANKGWKKILGDVFEAYVAAVVLSSKDAEEGNRIAEAWLGALWSVKLKEAEAKDDTLRAKAVMATKRDGTDGMKEEEQSGEDLSKVYSATGKMDLQKRIGGRDVTLLYERYRDSVELKGDQLGQSRHFIALYLTGYGYEKFLLGKGEGKGKAEAGNRAAVEAMHGQHKAIIDECELVSKKQKAERAEQKAKEAATSSET